MLGITRLETAHSNNDYVADSSPSSHPHAKSLMTFFHPFCVSSSLISCQTSSKPCERTEHFLENDFSLLH